MIYFRKLFKNIFLLVVICSWIFLDCLSIWDNPLSFFKIQEIQAATNSFTSGSGNWTSPVTGTVTIELHGGGGGGGYGGATNKYGGGGGAGGQAVLVTFSAVKNATYAYSVGSGGSGGTSGTPNGGIGGDTTFVIGGVTRIAKGGDYGRSYSNGRAGGTGSTTGGVGDTIYAGGSGFSGANTYSGGGGSGAGSTGTGNSATSYSGATEKVENGGVGGDGNTSNTGVGGDGGNYGGGGGGGTKNSNGGSGGSGYILITFADNVSPTVALNSPNNTAIISDATPDLFFTGTDTDDDALEYNVQIDTSNNFNSQSGNPILSRFSTSDNGFTAGHPFVSGVQITYTVQAGETLVNGTYYWRVGAFDPSGSNVYGAWSETRSFTVEIEESSATKIFRSVAPGATSVLANDGSHARTITISGGIATFSAELPDNVGVGDAVLIDTGGTDQTIDASDTLLFIHGRTDSTHYTVRTHTGASPSNIATNDTYSIYRAYTSLANAESGTKNTSIPVAFNGGDRDLVTNNEEWYIACYANGTTTESVGAAIDGWNTGVQNFIKIYTPTASTEVGISQRHSGRWDDYKWNLQKTTDWGTLLSIAESNVIIDGLQLRTTQEHNGGISVTYNSAVGETGNVIITNCIVQNTSPIKNSTYSGIAFEYENSGYHEATVRNCIIDGYYGGFGLNINGSLQKIYVYNNTVANATRFTYRGSATFIRNALMTNVGYFMEDNTPNSSNVSHIVTDGVVSFNTAGFTAIYENQTIKFVDKNNKDFHLDQSDTVARGTGTNLTGSAYFPFATDIDGQLRNSTGVGWDIGADEGTVEFTSTVMQNGGDYSTLSSWEAGVQTDLIADTTRVFSHGGKTGTIADNASVTGQTSGATATVVHATTNQILLENISGTFVSEETIQVTAGNSVVISDNGNPASVVAKIDGAWTVADTTVVTVDGSNTGADNYIKVYTTETSRHNGKWDDRKYRLVAAGLNDNMFKIKDGYVRIDGLQLYKTNITYASIFGDIDSSNLQISNNISKVNGNTRNVNIAGTGTHYVWNNILYGIEDSLGGLRINNFNATLYAYNNTVIDADYHGTSYCYERAVGNFVAFNNIAQNCGDGYYGFVAGSDYNISNLAGDAPGANSKNSTTVSFVDAVNKDFHLASNDTAAKDAGTDLSVYFNNDIDGASRNSSINAWDIGADEVATQIFRSVGPSATGALATDNSHVDTVMLSGGIATFSTALADNIGVGDAVLIDTGGTDQIIDANDTLLFIHGRVDSTHYILRTHMGVSPADIASNDTYGIYRAYTSLSNAETGTKNTSIPSAFSGGNRDLVTNNEQWNIACYANGATVDSASTVIDGWTTGIKNFIKIYTPTTLTEVGASQRHQGKSTGNNYVINPSSTSHTISISINNVMVLGLEITDYGGFGNSSGGIVASGMKNITAGYNYIHDEIVNNNGTGISITGSSAGNNYVFNNIISNVYNGIGMDSWSGLLSYAYNNTVISASHYGYVHNNAQLVARNNIAQNCADGFSGSFNATSGYNISNLAGDAPGANSKNSTTVSFVDAANKDFHLASNDTVAKDAGTDLSIYFTDDIDGDPRDAAIDAWDIGADERKEIIETKEGIRVNGKVRAKGNVQFR